MSTEENKVIARRWYDIWKGDLAVADELFAADFVSHYPGDEATPDLAGYKQNVSWLLDPFADVQATIEDMVAEGDKVVVRWSWRATHRGEFMGIAPTGKRVTFTGISILRIVNSKIVEEWGEVDNLGLMQQVGAIPAE